MEYFYFEFSARRKIKEISTPVTIAGSGNNGNYVHRCNAIWDTGATSSMISRSVAEHLELKSTGKVKISGVHGTKETDTFMVDLIFGNGFEIPSLRVSEADDGGGFDVLIGMDVIGNGKLIVDGLQEGCYIAFAFPAADN